MSAMIDRALFRRACQRVLVSLRDNVIDSIRRILPSGQRGFNAVWATLEAIALCVITLAFNIWADRSDPFGMHAQFPYLWIVPALLAMRYGTAIGVTAVAVFLLSWFILPSLGIDTITPGSNELFPKSFFLGGLILVLICGQFADVWNAKTRRLRAVNGYLDERLYTLTKNHFLLRLSHERLEQDLLAKPLTLRETLARLRSLISAADQASDPVLPGAAEFIQLLGQSCQLEIAAVYPSAHAPGTYLPAVAALGEPTELDTLDPLLLYSLKEGTLAHIRTSGVSVKEREISRYLVCAPLMSSTGKSIGILTVEKLPFFALNDALLQLLSVLIGYYADGVVMSAINAPILQRYPECPPDMALDLSRLHRIRQEAGIDSSIVALVFKTDDRSLDILDQVKRLKRGVDLSWELESERHRVIITLLPLAGAAAVEGYLLRIESAIQSQFGIGLLTANISTHAVRVGAAMPVDTLAQLIARCDL